ncbi:MAG TPA: VWA domain-containing protein [Acidobacteriaceae bacterium]|nr:VWA domain-containing protein [Acidobacteriaceae bacterium]
MRHRSAVLVVFAWLGSFAVQAVAQVSAAGAAGTSTITTRSTLVLVPAIVHDKSGQLVFNLKAQDFALTDNGVPQKLRLEQDSGGQPLALVVDIEGGGAAADRISRFAPLIAMLDAVVGGVPHRIAVVGFDSAPVLVTDFTTDNDVAEKGIKDLIADNNGDDGAAILDSLSFALDLLRKQPPEYRRAILLVSETHDNASHIPVDDALRNLSNSNTAIYSIGFSSSISQAKHEAAKISQPDTPNPAGGCFARDPQSTQSRSAQTYDCIAELAPPLALAKAAFMAVRSHLETNIPEAAAHLTGGEYFTLGKQKEFERDLLTISNHIPNRYVLSFQPQSPQSGYHALKLTLPDYSGLRVSARTGYWADPERSASANAPVK